MRKGMFYTVAAMAAVSTLRVICGDWRTALEGAFLLFWVGVLIADAYIRMEEKTQQDRKGRR